MALQTTGPISLANIGTEFGDTAPHSMSEFYGLDGRPSSGPLTAGGFYGASDVKPYKLLQRTPINNRPNYCLSTVTDYTDTTALGVTHFWWDVAGGPLTHLPATKLVGANIQFLQPTPTSDISLVCQTAGTILPYQVYGDDYSTNPGVVDFTRIETPILYDLIPRSPITVEGLRWMSSYDMDMTISMDSSTTSYNPNAYISSLDVAYFEHNTQNKPLGTGYYPYKHIRSYLNANYIDQINGIINTDWINDTRVQSGIYEDFPNINAWSLGTLNMDGTLNAVYGLDCFDYFTFNREASTDAYGNPLPAGYYFFHKGYFERDGNTYIFSGTTRSFSTAAERDAVVAAYPTGAALANAAIDGTLTTNLTVNAILPNDAEPRLLYYSTAYLDGGTTVPQTITGEWKFEQKNPITGDFIGGLIREGDYV